MLAGVVLAALSFSEASARGDIQSTHYGKLTPGTSCLFIAEAECENNTSSGGIAVIVTIKNSNGDVVAQSSGTGTGNNMTVTATIPGALVTGNDTFTASVSLTQDSGEGDSTKAKANT